MAAAAAVAAGSASSIEVVEEEFSEREVEVAAILADLPSIVRARSGQLRRGQQQQRRPEIPSWGRRRPRTVPVGKPVAAGPDRGEGAASPDTPLAFPEDDGDEDEETAAAKEKARAHQEWVQEQHGVVASLSHENAHLLKQIEEFKARLQHSRSTNDSLKQMQSKHKNQRQRQQEEERKRKLQARATTADRPALGLDLNEPAEAEADVEEVKPQPQAATAQWCHRGQQQQSAMVQHKAALTAAARRRRQEIRRAKAAAAARIRIG